MTLRISESNKFDVNSKSALGISYSESLYIALPAQGGINNNNSNKENGSKFDSHSEEIDLNFNCHFLFSCIWLEIEMSMYVSIRILYERIDVGVVTCLRLSFKSLSI